VSLVLELWYTRAPWPRVDLLDSVDGWDGLVSGERDIRMERDTWGMRCGTMERKGRRSEIAEPGGVIGGE
jgi:hypothetical protein